jgi:hypothetical protein
MQIAELWVQNDIAMAGCQNWVCRWVFEHIYLSINGFDTLGMMEKLYKIKVNCIADSLATLKALQ